MNEIINNYKLFAVVFVTLVLMGLLIFKFLFESNIDEERENDIALSSNEEERLLYAKEEDMRVFQKLNKILPPVAGSIFFLRSNNMTMVFHKRELKGLYTFYEGCKNGEYNFIDKELEELKIDFYNTVEKYLLTFESNSKETSQGYYRVHYNIDRLHLLVDELLAKYDKLSSVSQKKLLLSKQ